MPLLAERRILLDPEEFSPCTGTELLQTFLKHPSFSPGLRYELRDFILSIRTTVVEHDKKDFEMTWKNFVEAERKVYDQIQDPSPFQPGSTDGLENHGPCRYIYFQIGTLSHCYRPSGIPENVLHVILDCPRIKKGTYSHLKSPPLDSKNRSTKLLLAKGKCKGKGFSAQNCFLFDSFPRRCNFSPTSATPSPRSKWPAFRDVHDQIHAYWRSRGGKVVLLMGENAENAYNDVVQHDGVLRESILSDEALEVWVERSPVRSSRSIRVLKIGWKEEHYSNCDKGISSCLFLVCKTTVKRYYLDG
jgi:hypothetical protein